MADQAAGWPQGRRQERRLAPAKPKAQASPEHASPEDHLHWSALPDNALMERLQAGEHDALSELFNRYYRLVLSVASKIVRDRAEAEDLMQEVFLELYRNADRFDPTKGTAKAWIVTLAYHKSLNRRKYLALRGAFENWHNDDWQLNECDQADSRSSPRSSIGGWGAHDDSEILAIVQQGLETLNPRQREVVQLACLEGYLLSEIAERTKESLGNVRHYYYRGISKLRQFVQEKEKEQKKEKSDARGGRAAAWSGGGK